MEIVIKIDENIYTRLFDNGIGVSLNDNIEMSNAIRNGTPLPKGHGRLIDGDKVLDDIEKQYPASASETDKCKKYARLVYYWAVKNAPTIIEADGGGEDEDRNARSV